MIAGRALAIAAHPDDIEFMMSGTLHLLRNVGYEVHYLALANGYAGSHSLGPEKATLIRSEESRRAAEAIGAYFHEPITNDAEIIYSIDLVRRVGAIVREIQPSIVLTHAPEDYMEDHTETSRIASTAAFNRHMPNFLTLPPAASYNADVTVYHALPHGLRDRMRRWIYPEIYVDISSVAEVKAMAINFHESQQSYLAMAQGFQTLESEMFEMCAAVGTMSKVFSLAEGWRRHSHLGFGSEHANPILEALGTKASSNPEYGESLRIV